MLSLTIFSFLTIITLGGYFSFVLTKRKKKYTYVLISVLVTITGLIATFVLDSIREQINRPSFEIKTQIKANEIELKLKINGKIDRLIINYPIKGTYQQTRDLNRITTAKTSKRVVGENNAYATTNNLELEITDIVSNANLEYTIFYKSSPTNTPPLFQKVQNSVNSYQLVYSWTWNGNIKEVEQWRGLDNDKILQKPPTIIQGPVLYKKALSPEERESIYRNGPPVNNY